MYVHKVCLDMEKVLHCEEKPSMGRMKKPQMKSHGTSGTIYKWEGRYVQSGRKVPMHWGCTSTQVHSGYLCSTEHAIGQVWVPC